jgi:hypothetical protein
MNVSGGLLEICTNTCSRKLLVVTMESEIIQPGNTELSRKGVKCTNMQTLPRAYPKVFLSEYF